MPLPSFRSVPTPVPTRLPSTSRTLVAALPRPAAWTRPEEASGDVEPLAVEVLDRAGIERYRDDWAELATRCLEPNVFLDPDFALPAAQHLTPHRRLAFITVWASGGSGRRDLVALCPVLQPSGPFRRLIPVWSHDLAPLGVPLLDRSRGEAALRAMLGWIGQAWPRGRALLFRDVPSDGLTAALLARVAAAAGRRTAVVDSWSRAVLRQGTADERNGLAALSARGAKEARRQRRRLAERGDLAYTATRNPDDLRDAVERFLGLEARGWKGARGTALLCDPARSAFARTTARLLGQAGRCRIESLSLDGAPIAMAVVLKAGDSEFLWKIAYDETLAQFSPGVQLVLELTEAQGRGRSAALTDSCAVANHPMIDRLWPGRQAMSDVMVATQPDRVSGFDAALGRERGLRRLKALAKRAMAWRLAH